MRCCDGLGRLPKVLTETGSNQVLDLCRSAERISQYLPEDTDSGVALWLRMLIRALLKPHFRASPGVILFGAMRAGQTADGLLGKRCGGSLSVS